LFSFFFFCGIVVPLLSSLVVVVVIFLSLPLSSELFFVVFLFVLAKSFERAALKPLLPLLLVRPFESILEDDDGDASGSRIAPVDDVVFVLLASPPKSSRNRRRRLDVVIAVAL